MPRRRVATARLAERAPTRVAYLFGAGATHAELADACKSKMSEGLFLEQNSLLLANVSKRVCQDAKEAGDIPGKVRRLLSPAGLSNIELFISLLQENHVDGAEDITKKLLRRLRNDILHRIRPRKKRFYLHKALLEFHKTHKREMLVGIISLNYDGLLDEAYESTYKQRPNHGLSAGPGEPGIPLLKLHGGFDLTYRERRLPLITPGVYKNYLELPYNFVWGRALELLLECDILRVVGCSLSQNDIGIVDLLFKAHIGRDEPYLLQVIDFDPKGNRIKEHLGFFPRIERATEIEGRLISDATIQDNTTGSNPFKIWLKAKIERTMKADDIKKTRYVKRVLA